MDTRSKILTLEQAAALSAPLAIAAGTFDILRAEHAREMDDIRRRTAPAKLLAVVITGAGGPLSPRARAELAAALRVIDYVVIADIEDLERLSRVHQAAEIVRLEAADRLRLRQLIEHVRQRQNA